MKRSLITTLATFLVLAALTAQAATTNQFVTMNVPEAIIAEAMKQVVPLTLDGNSSRLEGTITIIDISNFQIKNQQIFCHLDLMGNNLHLVTTVANQNIRLKLGSARIDLDCDAQIRFDRSSQTLYIRPLAKDTQGSDPLIDGDIGQALLLFLNGKEFPISMQNLKPIVARASGKSISIKTHIVDIRAIEGALQFDITPIITTSPIKKKAPRKKHTS